jgi:hypothetical protein
MNPFAQHFSPHITMEQQMSEETGTRRNQVGVSATGGSASSPFSRNYEAPERDPINERRRLYNLGAKRRNNDGAGVCA